MGLMDFFTGGDTSGDVDKLVNALWQGNQMFNYGTHSAMDILNQSLGNALGYLAPYTKIGTASTNVLGGLLNLPGYAPVDRTAYLTGAPGYKFGLNQGLNALNASAAARGLYGSGPQREAAIKYGTDYGTNYFNQLMNQLAGQENIGYGAGAQSGQWQMNTGNALANLEEAMAQNAQNTNATGATAQYQNALQNQQAQNQGLGNVLGLGLRLATSPLLATGLETGINALSSSNIGPYMGMSMTLPEVYEGGAGSYNAFNPNPLGGWNLAA
jgi:hypothetical protein